MSYYLVEVGIQIFSYFYLNKLNTGINENNSKEHHVFILTKNLTTLTDVIFWGKESKFNFIEVIEERAIIYSSSNSWK